MRALATILTLLMLSAISATSGYAQVLVTVRGTIQSLDSTRANMVVRSGGQDRLIVLPVDVAVEMENDASRQLGLNDLVQGGVIVVDSTKSPNGQLTARRVVVLSTPGGSMSPTGPSPANRVTVQPSRGARSGVVVSPGAGTGDAGDDHFVAARASLLGQRVGELHVNGRTVFRFRGTRGEDPYVRARTVAGRLNSPSMANLRSSEVRAQRVGSQWAVMARGVVLITADSTTARVNRTSPRLLAQQWAANMRAQLM